MLSFCFGEDSTGLLGVQQGQYHIRTFYQKVQALARVPGLLLSLALPDGAGATVFPSSMVQG